MKRFVWHVYNINTILQEYLQGVLAGLASGLAFTLWISFGEPKPPLPKLPVSVDGCNSTIFRSYINGGNMTDFSVNIPKVAVDER